MDNKLKENQPQIRMPRVCARCGIEAGEHPWPIRSRFNHTFYVVAMTYKTAGFVVPVCNHCKAQMQKDSTKWAIILFIAGFGALALFYLASQFAPYIYAFVFLALLACLVFVIAVIKRQNYWYSSGIATYDGKYFTFYNKEFQKQFADLNPILVRKA